MEYPEGGEENGNKWSAPSEREIREKLLGVGEDAVFSDAMQEKLADQLAATDSNAEYSTSRIGEELASHGFSADLIDPAAICTITRKLQLTDSDWAEIAEADEPLVPLISRANRRAYENNRKQDSGAYHRGHGWQPTSPLNPSDIRFHSLPLLHGTSLLALEAAVEQGEFVSNKALAERGDDVTSGVGNTHAYDRELGLDNYVFADFGRPRGSRVANQAEVTVVLTPKAMLSKGTFLTKHDIADTNLISRGGQINYRSYAQSLYTPEDFYEVGLDQIKQTSSFKTHRGEYDDVHDDMTLDEFASGADGNPNSAGGAQFSTWEVKLPVVSVDQVDRIIFKDAEQCAAFQAKHGDRFSCIVEPDLKTALEEQPYEILGTQERFDEAYAAALVADYKHRRSVLEETPAEERTEGYMILNLPNTLPSAVRPELLNPLSYSYASTSGRKTPPFPSAEEALLVARAGHAAARVGDFSNNFSHIHSPEVQIAKVNLGSDGSAVTERLDPYDLDLK